MYCYSEEPKEKDRMDPITVLNIDTLSMMCKFRARPGADITWKYRNDTALPFHIFSLITETELDGKYTITTSTLSWNADSDPDDRRHSGGQIKCVAQNVVDTAEISAKTLNVECESWCSRYIM